MARPMQNFRKFVRGVLDGITDETRDAVRQAAKAAKKGTAFHAEVWTAMGLQGQVTEDSQGGLDIDVRGTVPLAPTGVLAGGTVTPSIGWSSGTQGNFLGPGQLNVGCRVVIVNAHALEAGVDATDPGETDELPEGSFR